MGETTLLESINACDDVFDNFEIIDGKQNKQLTVNDFKNYDNKNCVVIYTFIINSVKYNNVALFEKSISHLDSVDENIQRRIGYYVSKYITRFFYTTILNSKFHIKRNFKPIAHDFMAFDDLIHVYGPRNFYIGNECFYYKIAQNYLQFTDFIPNLIKLMDFAFSRSYILGNDADEGHHVIMNIITKACDYMTKEETKMIVSRYYDYFFTQKIYPHSGEPFYWIYDLYAYADRNKMTKLIYNLSFLFDCYNFS